MGRNPCCDKEHVKRGPWTAEEDAILKEYIAKHGGHGGSWTTFPEKAGLNRCGRSCRLRWLNYLKPDLKLGKFSEAEEISINYWVNRIGKKWSVIASFLPGRTDNDIKNYWKIKTRKEAAATASSTTQNKNDNILVNISPQQPSPENVSNSGFYSDTNSQTFLQNSCAGDASVLNLFNFFSSPQQYFPSSNYPISHQQDCYNLTMENNSCLDSMSEAIGDQAPVEFSDGEWSQIPQKNNSCLDPMVGNFGDQAHVGFPDGGWSQIPGELNMPGAFTATEDGGFNQLFECQQSSLVIKINSRMDTMLEAAGDHLIQQPDCYYSNLIENKSGMNSMFVAAYDQEFLGISGGQTASYGGINDGGHEVLHNFQERSFEQFQLSNDKVFDTDTGSYDFNNMSANASSLMPQFDRNKNCTNSLCNNSNNISNSNDISISGTTFL